MPNEGLKGFLLKSRGVKLTGGTVYPRGLTVGELNEVSAILTEWIKAGKFKIELRYDTEHSISICPV